MGASSARPLILIPVILSALLADVTLCTLAHLITHDHHTHGSACSGPCDGPHDHADDTPEAPCPDDDCCGRCQGHPRYMGRAVAFGSAILGSRWPHERPFSQATRPRGTIAQPDRRPCRPPPNAGIVFLI